MFPFCFNGFITQMQTQQTLRELIDYLGSFGPNSKQNQAMRHQTQQSSQVCKVYASFFEQLRNQMSIQKQNNYDPLKIIIHNSKSADQSNEEQEREHYAKVCHFYLNLNKIMQICTIKQSKLQGPWIKPILLLLITAAVILLCHDKTFKFGKRTLLSGEQVIEFQDGSIFTGGVVNGRFEGYGELHYANGDIYRGNFVDNKKSGYGELHYANSGIYKGNYKDDKRSGQGEYMWANGDSYDGDWLAHKKHGTGVLRTANGDIYTGAFAHNKRNGIGMLRTANGEIYTGAFAHDVKHGSGTLYTAHDGRVTSQLWSMGELQRIGSKT